MNIAQLPVRAVARALHVFDVVVLDNRLVCVRHGRAPRAALTTSTSSRATAALEAVAWPSAQARSNDRQRCRHQSVHFMRVSSTHFVRAIAASLWRALIALPPWCALRRSRLLPPSQPIAGCTWQHAEASDPWLARGAAQDVKQSTKVFATFHSLK